MNSLESFNLTKPSPRNGLSHGNQVSIRLMREQCKGCSSNERGLYLQLYISTRYNGIMETHWYARVRRCRNSIRNRWLYDGKIAVAVEEETLARRGISCNHQWGASKGASNLIRQRRRLGRFWISRPSCHRYNTGKPCSSSIRLNGIIYMYTMVPWRWDLPFSPTLSINKAKNRWLRRMTRAAWARLFGPCWLQCDKACCFDIFTYMYS